MMRANKLIVSAVIALPVGFGAASAVNAAVNTNVSWAGDEVKTAEGTIKSVDAKANSFVLSTGTGKDAKDITVRVNKDTKYTLDGKESTMEKALAAGHKAKVTHKDNTASKVDATTVAKK